MAHFANAFPKDKEKRSKIQFVFSIYEDHHPNTYKQVMKEPTCVKHLQRSLSQHLQTGNGRANLCRVFPMDAEKRSKVQVVLSIYKDHHPSTYIQEMKEPTYVVH